MAECRASSAHLHHCPCCLRHNPLVTTDSPLRCQGISHLEWCTSPSTRRCCSWSALYPSPVPQPLCSRPLMWLPAMALAPLSSSSSSSTSSSSPSSSSLSSLFSSLSLSSLSSSSSSSSSLPRRYNGHVREAKAAAASGEFVEALRCYRAAYGLISSDERPEGEDRLPRATDPRRGRSGADVDGGRLSLSSTAAPRSRLCCPPGGRRPPLRPPSPHRRLPRQSGRAGRRFERSTGDRSGDGCGLPTARLRLRAAVRLPARRRPLVSSHDRLTTASFHPSTL